MASRTHVVLLGVICAAIVALIVGVVVATAAAPNPASSARPSPVAVAQAFFKDINRHDLSLIESAIVPRDRYMVANVSDWDLYHFVRLRCHRTAESQLTASVQCGFMMHSPAPPEMYNVSFWDLSLQRSSSGSWLISNYGQG